MGLLKSILNSILSDSQTNNYQSKPVGNTPVYESVERTYSETISHFSDIIGSEFTSYSVRRDVPVKDLAGDVEEYFLLYTTRPTQAYKAEWGLPYTFVLYKEDKPAGIVFVGEEWRMYNKVKYLISKMYAKKMRIPFIPFYADQPNDRNYVVNRIRKNIL